MSYTDCSRSPRLSAAQYSLTVHSWTKTPVIHLYGITKILLYISLVTLSQSTCVFLSNHTKETRIWGIWGIWGVWGYMESLEGNEMMF